jgi:hypothetical protein
LAFVVFDRLDCWVEPPPCHSRATNLNEESGYM